MAEKNRNGVTNFLDSEGGLRDSSIKIDGAIEKTPTQTRNQTMKTRTDERHSNWKGMNWIRQEKRLAIYLRDGLACAWCGDSVENGASLTLDHVTPDSRGGSNDATNLVACCHRCNSSRGNRSVRRFSRAVADYLNHGVEPVEIERHVRATIRRPLPLDEAKTLIARRGSAARVLAHIADKRC